MRHYDIMKLRKAAHLLKCMAHPLRLSLLCRLSAARELCAGDLVAMEKTASQSQVSQYLGILRRLKLVQARRSGKMVYYRLASAEARGILKALYALYCGK